MNGNQVSNKNLRSDLPMYCNFLRDKNLAKDQNFHQTQEILLNCTMRWEKQNKNDEYLNLC